MANPIVDAVTYDKVGGYNVGDLVTATMHYHDADAKVYNAAGVVTDAEGDPSGAYASQFTVNDPCNASFSDDGGHTWTKVSDDHVGLAVFTTHV